MHKNVPLNNSKYVEKRDQEDHLDASFKQYIIMLQLLCSRHTNCTDLVLCRKWVHRLAHATKQERYARNYLLSLLCNQVTCGHLRKPFTDGRYLKPHFSLRNIILSLLKYDNYCAQLIKRQSVPDSRSFAFRNNCEGKESLRQRSLSANCSFDRQGNQDTLFFYNIGQTYNQQAHGQISQSENRVFLPFYVSPFHKRSEYGKEPLKHFQRSFQQRSESADRPSSNLRSQLRKSGTHSNSVLVSKELQRMRQSPECRHIGSQYQYSTRGIAGGAMVANNLYTHQDEMDRALNELYKLKREYGFLLNEYRRMHLQIEQLHGKMQHKSNRLTIDCCHNYGHNSPLSSEVPQSNNNCQHMWHSHFQGCHEDPDGSAYSDASNNYNTNTNINVYNKNTPVLTIKKHIEMLQKQLIKSAHITINQLTEITSLNGFETQQGMLVRQRTQKRNTENYQKTMTNCQHQLFSKSLAALSYNDKSFDEFLRISDVYIDKLVNAIFECNSEIRKKFVERELNKLWEIMSEHYSEEHKSNMKQHKKAEKLHTGLNQLRMLTILKKLFLENCVDKLDHVDKVLDRLDKGFALMEEHLS